MRIRRGGAWLPFMATAVLFAARVASAQTPAEAVGNVGLLSADVPTAELLSLETALDRAVVVNASATRGRTATLSTLSADPEISSRRAEARRSADAGANAMRSLELDRAQGEFDKAVTLFNAAHGERLDTGDLSRLHNTRAKVALIRQDKAGMRQEFARSIQLHPTKTLDPNAFPPDAVATFADVLATASRTPPSPPSSAALADIARRSGVRWIVAGDVRRGTAPGAYVVALTLADVTGAGKATTVEIPPDGAMSALDVALRNLFAAAGVPAASAASNLARMEPSGSAGGVAGGTQPATRTSEIEPSPAATPVPASTPVAVAATPKPVPAKALPSKSPPPGTKRAGAANPWYRQWYVIGAGIAVVGAGVAVAATSGGGSGSGNEESSGITLIIDRP